jgi:hypothetical protein
MVSVPSAAEKPSRARRNVRVQPGNLGVVRTDTGERLQLAQRNRQQPAGRSGGPPAVGTRGRRHPHARVEHRTARPLRLHDHAVRARGRADRLVRNGLRTATTEQATSSATCSASAPKAGGASVGRPAAWSSPHRDRDQVRGVKARWPDRLLARIRGEERLLSACVFCDWQATGTVEETQAAFAAHTCDRPKPVKPVRRRSGFALRQRPRRLGAHGGLQSAARVMPACPAKSESRSAM